MRLRKSLGLVLVSFLLGVLVVGAQPAPWRLVQAPEGTLYVIADGVRHRIVPAPISGEELSVIAEAEPWEDGTIAIAVPQPAAASATAPEPAEPEPAAPPPPPATPPSKADSRYVDPRQLAAEPRAFVGRNIWLQGEAQNVSHNEATQSRQSYTWVHLRALVSGRTTEESISVIVTPKDPGILKDECYRFYGVGIGTWTVRRTLTGVLNETPAIRAYAWEPAPRERNRCAAP